MWAGRGRLSSKVIAVVEWPEPKGKLLTSRRKEYEPAIELIRPLVGDFLSTPRAVSTAMQWTRENARMWGAFSEQAAYDQIIHLGDYPRMATHVHPQTPLHTIEQEQVHPLARVYRFPGVFGAQKSFVVRQLKRDERYIIVRYALNELVERGQLGKIRKKFGWGFFMVESAHGEEAPPPQPPGPSAPSGLDRSQER